MFSSNPSFVDIYGVCGVAMLNEKLHYGSIEHYATHQHVHKDDEGPIVLNKIDPSTKLVLSLQMAEALAYLHNFDGGVIVHDDLHLGQVSLG